MPMANRKKILFLSNMMKKFDKYIFNRVCSIYIQKTSLSRLMKNEFSFVSQQTCIYYPHYFINIEHHITVPLYRRMF